MTETMRIYPCDLTAFGECPKCPWERDCSKCGEDVVFEEDDEGRINFNNPIKLGRKPQLFLILCSYFQP